MGLKRFTFDYDKGESIVSFFVDNKFTKEMAKAFLDFFSEECDEEDSVIKVALEMVAKRLMNEGTCDPYACVDSMKREVKQMEGFFLLDGEIGVTLTEFKPYEFQAYNLETKITRIRVRGKADVRKKQ
jgi:hypothetical protein